LDAEEKAQELGSPVVDDNSVSSASSAVSTVTMNREQWELYIEVSFCYYFEVLF